MDKMRIEAEKDKEVVTQEKNILGIRLVEEEEARREAEAEQRAEAEEQARRKAEGV